ncbi:right-handed parallel beta-helix repeat-containing protein [candidate division KSB1 bacterium]|nr:right-handed parallel beta-helix repeat-containing protein [candidate division KSB1 bacterium]
MKQLIFFIFTVLQFSGFAAEYYVDRNHSSADDANPGTAELPFATIQCGVEKAQPGDTVLIKGSPEPDSDHAVYIVSGNGITTVRNGSAGNDIIIKTYPGHSVIIKGNGTGVGIELEHASYHQFHGLTFKEFKKATEGYSKTTHLLFENCEFSNTYETGLRLRNIEELVMRDCYVHHCWEAGISLRGGVNCLFERVESSYNSDGKGASGDGDGFHTYGGENIQFIDCTAQENSEDGFDLNANGIMKNCKSFGHTACNVKLWRRDQDGYAPKITTIVNSLIYNAGEAGIKISKGAQLRLFDSVIYNNGEEGVAFRGVDISQEPSVVKSQIINNIFVGNGYGGIEVRQSGPNVNKISADYNLYYNNGRENTGLDQDTDMVAGKDPLFVDAAESNFHLKSESPAIDAGMTKDVYQSIYYSYGVDLSVDLDGNERPFNAVWDIGAYEYCGTTRVQQEIHKTPTSIMYQNYPNPFNPTTMIQFDIPKRSRVKLEIYNVYGQLIITLADRFFGAGSHAIQWDGMDKNKQYAASGAYYYRLITDDLFLSKNMLLLR